MLVDETIDLAERVAEVLDERGVAAVMIGGYALALHNYPRATEDLDLGVAVKPTKFAALCDELNRRGFTAELEKPDGDDPLGGVVRIRDATGALVEVVNFDNHPGGGFPRVIEDALAAAKAPPAGSRLRVVPLPQLIALKLYAAVTPSSSSLQDIRELLASNPDADVAAIKHLCEVEYRLRSYGVFG